MEHARSLTNLRTTTVQDILTERRDHDNTSRGEGSWMAGMDLTHCILHRFSHIANLALYRCLLEHTPPCERRQLVNDPFAKSGICSWWQVAIFDPICVFTDNLQPKGFVAWLAFFGGFDKYIYALFSGPVKPPVHDQRRTALPTMFWNSEHDVEDWQTVRTSGCLH